MQRLAHESDRDFTQRRTFLGWINFALQEKDYDPIENPVQDLSDGIVLCRLYSYLVGKELKYDSKPKNKIKCLANLQLAFQAFEAAGFRPFNVGPTDIYEKNYSLTMGLLWTLVRKFHVQMQMTYPKESKDTPLPPPAEKSQEEEDAQTKKMVLEFVNKRLNLIGEKGALNNFSGDFQDGKALSGLVASYDPSFLKVHKMELTPLQRMRRAFAKAQALRIAPAILSAEDINQRPDENSLLTYLGYFTRPELVELGEEAEVYYNSIKQPSISECHTFVRATASFDERKRPSNRIFGNQRSNAPLASSDTPMADISPLGRRKKPSSNQGISRREKGPPPPPPALPPPRSDRANIVAQNGQERSSTIGSIDESGQTAGYHNPGRAGISRTATSDSVSMNRSNHFSPSQPQRGQRTVSPNGRVGGAQTGEIGYSTIQGQQYTEGGGAQPQRAFIGMGGGGAQAQVAMQYGGGAASGQEHGYYAVMGQQGLPQAHQAGYGVGVMGVGQRGMRMSANRSLVGLTFQVIERDDFHPCVGETYSFMIDITGPPENLDSQVLPMRQLKITNPKGQTVPFQLQYLGNKEGTDKTAELLVDFVPTEEGNFVVTIVDDTNTTLLTHPLKDSVLVSMQGFSVGTQKAEKRSRISFYAGGQKCRASVNPLKTQRSQAAQLGDILEPQEQQARDQQQQGREEEEQPQPQQSPTNHSNSSFQGGEGEGERDGEEEKGRVRGDTKGLAGRPGFKKTAATLTGKLLKVYLDDDEELEQFGLRQACISVKYEGLSMRAAKLKEMLKTKMVQRLDKTRTQKLLEYVQYFVIVELDGETGEHRVVGKSEPLDRWEIEKCPANRCLMFLPFKSHYDFIVDYPVTRVRVGDTLVVRIEISDPFKLNRPVVQHGGYLSLCVTNRFGVQVEYEAAPLDGQEGTHLAEVVFASPGKYYGMVQFDGHAVQSCNAVLRVSKGKGAYLLRTNQKTKHKKKESKSHAPSFNPKFF